MDIKDSGARFIDAHIRVAPGEPVFHVTFVYGEPRVENRHRMWSLLSAIGASSSLPWLVLGDFNEALWQYEHFSACLRAESQMAAFRDCVQVCELNDLGFSGLPFTFDNKRAGHNNVRVRLDRALTDNSWRDIFSDSSVVHLVSPCLDHCPILLSMAKEIRPAAQGHCPRYEIFWERDPTLKEFLDTSWRDLGPLVDLGSVNDGLQVLMRKLQAWGRKKFGNVTKELSRLRGKLKGMQDNGAP